ncbi:MAG: hypothetical protein L6R43_18510, partial [Planctomycetes bacterium]|nr:hypothetical protein [Planctomycetota bacterium]
HIPVHVISVADLSQEALEMGAAGYALKPVPREELAEALRRRTRWLVDRIVLPVGDPRAERLLSAARILRAKGEAALLAGDVAPGTRLLAAALRKAGPLL